MITQKHWKNLSKSKAISPLVFFRFILDVFRTEKLSEIFSFFIWECYHQLKLFKKSSYLPLNEKLTNLKVEDLFTSDEILINVTQNSAIKINTASLNWHVLHFDAEDNIWGSAIENQNILYFKHRDREEISKVFEFPEPIKSIYISDQQDIFVCSGGKIYRSSITGGASDFTCVLNLIAPESIFRHNNTFTETPDGTLLIGEYVVIWKSHKCVFGAILYYSHDAGKTWKKSEFLRKAHVNKHIHLVKYSNHFNRLILAEGDNKKRLWAKKDEHYTPESIDNLQNWENFTHYHLQMGGYTSMVEVNGKLIFGTDYMGGTNFIVQTADLKNFTRKVIPDPYRRGWITNMAVTKGNKIWATIRFASSSKTRSLLMFSMDDGETWNKILDYDGTKYFVDIISSSRKKQNTLYFEMRTTEKNADTPPITKVVSFIDKP